MLITTQDLSDRDLELFARRLLPEVKKFFDDEEVKKEFSEWKAKLVEIKE